MRKFYKASAIIALLVVSHGAMAQITDDLSFRNGERVRFIGNSITHGGEFHAFIQLYYATRFPDRKVEFHNLGIWGDNANSFLRRMDDDILARPADYSIIMAGMNDVNRALYAASRQNDPDIEARKQRALDDYRGYLTRVIEKLLSTGSTVILQKPSIYDQTGDLPAENLMGVNDALGKCGVIIDELATAYSLRVVDYWTILNELNGKVQAANPKATLISNDRVHPGTAGHFIMACEFLRSTGAPKFVADVQIAAGTLRTAKNCIVSDITTSDSTLSFGYEANSLPFPVPDAASAALDLVPFSDELNSERLVVRDLPHPVYTLTIGGFFIGNFSREQLAGGINLALEKRTPQYKQAVRVRSMTTEYRTLQRTLRDIRRIEINYLPASLRNATFTEIKPYIDDLRKSGDPLYTANRSLFDNYLTQKPRETQTREAVAATLDGMYRINKPLRYEVRLEAGATEDPERFTTHAWEFEEPVVSNVVEGWTVVNYGSPNTANGILNLTGVQTYNHIRYNVPSANAVDPLQVKTAIIKLKNQTFETRARFYWWSTTASAAFIEFDISANDTTFREYRIDLTKSSSWSGAVSIIRFDVPSPLLAASYGKSVAIDYVKLSSEQVQEPQPEPDEPMPARFPAHFGVNLAGAEFGQNMPGQYGTDYTWPNRTELAYFKSKNMRLVRVPFKWERIQPILNGPLDVNELERMKTFVASARAEGMWVLLDMHNYGRRKINGVEYIVGDPALPVSSLTDAWKKLAGEFSTHTNIWGYGLMNEPHGMLPGTPWVTIAQALIDGIRTVDQQTVIVVGGDSWSSAARWPVASDNLKTLNDPSDNLVFEAHVYFDNDASGAYDGTYDVEGATPQTGVDRVAPFVNWLKQNGKQGFVGEYGVPDDDARWLTTLDNMLAYLKSNCVNGTYWAAGPWWGSYRLAVEPIGGTDRPQMAVLEKYTTSDTECSGDAGNDPVTHRWEFVGAVENNRIEGWNIINYTNASAEAGILSLTLSQTYHNIRYDVPSTNAVDPLVSKYATIRLKNGSAQTKARFYWWAVGDNTPYFAEFDITANDTGFREYTIDLGSIANWATKGSIRIIRFDVPATTGTESFGNTVSIDWINLRSSLPAVQQYAWPFDAPVVNNRVEGWTIVNYTDASTSNGVLSLKAAQTYNNIRYDVPATAPIEPSVYRYVTVTLKNPTNEGKARFYWWGPVGDNTANFVEFDIVSNDANFREYTIALSQQPLWNQKSSVRIIRFDIPSPVGSASLGMLVYVDHIRISSHLPATNSDTAMAATGEQSLSTQDELLSVSLLSATHSDLTMRITAPSSGPASVMVTDVYGRQTGSGEVVLRPGLNEVLVPVSGLLPGTLYVLRVHASGSSETIKFAIAK